MVLDVLSPGKSLDTSKMNGQPFCVQIVCLSPLKSIGIDCLHGLWLLNYLPLKTKELRSK
jgi:hypothetical protein